jgi:hypothetical protein
MYLSTTFPVKIYDTKVQFIITSDIVKVANRIHAFHKAGNVWRKEEVSAGCTILCSMSKYYILINSSYLSYNTICHELYHCTCAIAFDRGIHEEEARAWIQGYIANQIFKFIKEKEKQKEHNIEISCD